MFDVKGGKFKHNKFCFDPQVEKFVFLLTAKRDD